MDLLLYGADFNPFASLILIVALPLSVCYYLLPGVVNGLVLSADLPQYIAKVDLGLRIVWAQLNRLLAELEPLLVFVGVDAHHRQVRMGIHISPV